MSVRASASRVLLLAAAAIATATLVGLTVYYQVVASSWNDRIAAFWWAGWIGFSVVGGVLVHRRPHEPVGRLLTLIGFFVVVTVAGAGYSSHDYGADGRLGPLGVIAALVYDPAFAAAFACTMATVLTFPSGRLDTRLRRFGGRLIQVAVTLTVAGYLLRPRLQVGEGKWADNPLHPAFLAGIPNVAIVLGIVALAVAGAVAVIGSVITFRRSIGDERQQMRWFARSAAILPAMFVVSVIVSIFNQHQSDWLVFAGLVVGLNAIAVAIGVAVSRYRLYDIDRIVSRTASYALVTGLVIGGYVGLIALIETVFGGSGGVSVAASTLAAAAAFQPLRRRVQRMIDRRFDRAAYDARLTVDAFSHRLRDEVDVDTVRADLLATVAGAVAPTSESVWLVHR
jgi:hypothetical protein